MEPDKWKSFDTYLLNEWMSGWFKAGWLQSVPFALKDLFTLLQWHVNFFGSNLFWRSDWVNGFPYLEKCMFVNIINFRGFRVPLLPQGIIHEPLLVIVIYLNGCHEEEWLFYMIPLRGTLRRGDGFWPHMHVPGINCSVTFRVSRVSNS